jgi:hypothetical protein
VPFDSEVAITIVYRNIRERSAALLDYVEEQTNGFRNFDPDFINRNPHLLSHIPASEWYIQ